MSEARLADLTYAELIKRIAEPDAWSEFLSRYHARLEGFRDWYYHNRIRGGAVTFDDVLQELLAPSEKRPIGYLQKALIDECPATEEHFLRLAKLKFRQRLIDEARREAGKQLVIAADFAADIPDQQPHGLASMEIWQIVRNAVGSLDETERIATRLYYQLPETQEGDNLADAIEAKKINGLIKEMQKRGVELSYGQAVEKLKRARRLLRIVLLPYSESLDDE